MDLKQLRQKKSLTQQQLADQLKITTRMYQYLEKGDYKPSVKMAKQLASLLDFHWTEFFQEENK